MPFDEDEDDLPADNQKSRLKNVSTQQSIFDKIPPKPSQKSFEKQVQSIQEKNNQYKQRAAELAIQFKKSVEDKTLPQNKNMFASEIERELLSKMIELAVEINNDPNEQEGMGSLGWIALLLRTILSQRDKINKLEYNLSTLEKKLEPANLSAQIAKEMQTLDKKKNNE